LLKYLALTFARRQARVRLELDEERLPIFITLRDFSRFLDHAAQRDSRSYTSPLLLPRFLNDHIKAIAPHLNLPDDFFSRQLEAGKCIVLLDGLDEITDPSKRGRVIEVIASFTPHYRGNRFILTSRPRGYEGEAKQRLSSFCAECTIRDFDEEDMAAFARSWYTAVTIDRLGDNPTARDTALTRADDLLYAVRADERVKALAHNPLLLSVLAMVHQRGVGLPQRRAELYDECTDMLLGYWDQTKGGEAARELANAGALTRAEKRTLLEPIALWFHERGEQGLEASKEKLEKEIAHQFQEIFSDDETKARSRAVLFLRVIDERAGLLVERETGVYAFAHLTFQEYLAACAIADRDDYIAYTLRHLHDPWWREVILLEVGHLSDMRHFGRRARKLTSDLIRAIRNTGSWLEDVLKQDFLFAARCLCDAGPLGVDDELRQALIDELLTLWRTTLYHPQWQEVTSIFAFAIPTVDGPRIRAELLGCLNETDKLLRIRSLATLRRIGAAVATEEIVARMLALTADENVDVRREAVRVLGRMANMVAMRETMERLLVLISRGDWEVTSVVAEALRTLGGAVAPDIVARLFSFTTDEDPHVRNAAIQALGAVGKVSPGEVEIVERLVTLIANADAHWSMEYAVVQTFEALGAAAAKPEVVARLLTLATDTHAVVRVNAIRALEGIGKAAARPEVVVRLLALTADEDARVRQVATAALGAMGKGIATPQVVTRLLELTDDPSVRREALIALGAIDEATPEVVAQLLKIIGGTDTQQIAAAVLGQLGDTVATKEVITRLLTLVADKTLDVRLATLRALGEIGEAAATKEVVTQLLELLTNTDARIDVRYEAAWALGQMSKVATSTELVDSLARFWQDHLNDDRRYGIGRVYGPVCEAAYEELQRLAARQERKPQP